MNYRCFMVVKTDNGFEKDGQPLFDTDGSPLSRWLLAPGAMWWSKGPEGDPKCDGRLCLYVKTPGGWWNIDGSAFDQCKGGYYGEGWKRTGEPPLITVTPSIHFPGSYHGVLEQGELKGV